MSVVRFNLIQLTACYFAQAAGRHVWATGAECNHWCCSQP